MNKTTKRHALKNPDKVFIANMTGILLGYESFQQNSRLILKQKKWNNLCLFFIFPKQRFPAAESTA